jgi:DivIVA domain-containing protein
MDISPQLLRDVEFREQRRGYSPNEVDDFLERLAVGIGQLQQQVKDATARAEEAERRGASGSTDEDGIKRTLVLAQRTADAALEEARQQAAATVAEAEERAAQLVAGAEEQAGATERAAAERAATTVSQAEARVADELVPLLSQRDALHRDVEALQAWATDVRSRLADELRQQLACSRAGRPSRRPPQGWST